MEFTIRLQNSTVTAVYPSLSDDPGHDDLRCRLGPSAFRVGGRLTVGGRARDCAETLHGDFQNREGSGFMVVSLGYFDALMFCSASLTLIELTDDAIREASISQELCRMSIEWFGSLEQRWEQRKRAMAMWRFGLIG